jgi:hypothetical protein
MLDRYDEESPPQKKRRWWIWILVLVTAPILVALYYVVSARTGLNNLIAEIDRLDPGWRLEEIEGKRANYPPTQNAAVHIVKIKGMVGQNYNQLFNKEYQLLSILEPQALLNEQQIEFLGRLREASQDATAAARKLIDLPHGRYAIQWSPDWISTILKCQDNRQAVNLLRLDAIDLAQRGDADGALRSTHAAFHCGCSIGDEPMSISQLVRIACQAVAITTLERVLAQTEPSDEVLAAFQKRLEEEEQAPLLLIAFRGERAGEYHLLESMRDGTFPTGLSGAGMGGGGGLDTLFFRVPGVMAAQTAGCMRYMNDMVEVAKLPPEQWDAQFAVLRQQIPNLPVLAQLLAPAMDKIAQAVQRSYAQQRCAIVALAAERFRKKNNRWPESLEELKAAGLIKQIPTDPFVGGPLKWKRTDEGLMIYAVGPDLVDNGGFQDPAHRGRPGTDDSFRLWDVAKRRQPAPPPKRVEDEP